MDDQAVHQPGFFNLRGVAAGRKSDKGAVGQFQGGAFPLHGIDDLVFLGADEQHRHLQVLHLRADGVVVGALHGADQGQLPAPVLETLLVVKQHVPVGLARLVEDRLHHRLVIAAANAVHDGQFFHIPHAGGAQQHHPVDQFGVFGSELDGDLPAEAAGNDVIRRGLHKLRHERVQLLDEVINRDRQIRLQAGLKMLAVVGQQVRGHHIEVPAPKTNVPKPGFRLLRQAVDEDQRMLATVFLRPETAQQTLPGSGHGSRNSIFDGLRERLNKHPSGRLGGIATSE